MATKKFGRQRDEPTAHLDIVNRGKNDARARGREGDDPGVDVGVEGSGTGRELFASKPQNIINGVANSEEPLAYGSVYDQDDTFGPADADTSWHTSNSHPGPSSGHELEGGGNGSVGLGKRKGPSGPIMPGAVRQTHSTGKGALSWDGD